MNKRRFRRLYNFMRDKVPVDNFNIRTLLRVIDPHINPVTQLKEHTCGTTACFAGWCPVIFPTLWRFVDYCPHYGKRTNWTGSFAEFFDISLNEAEYICCVNSYPESIYADQAAQLSLGLLHMRCVARRYGLVLEDQ